MERGYSQYGHNRIWVTMVHTLWPYPSTSSHADQLGVDPLQELEGSAGVVKDNVGGRDSGHGEVCKPRIEIEAQVRRGHISKDL